MRVVKGSTVLDADVSLRSLNVSAYSDVAPCTSHRAWTFHSRGQLASTLCLLSGTCSEFGTVKTSRRIVEEATTVAHR